MSEFEDKLNGILNNPQEMEKIMALARNFMGGGGEATTASAPVPPPPPPTATSATGGGMDIGSLSLMRVLMSES